MKKTFEQLIDTLTETIFTHEYFVDFNKVFKNVNDLEYNLNILNYLLGKDNFDEAFIKVFNNNNKVVSVLPILLAIREKDLLVYDEIVIKYSFNKIMDVNYYLDFIHKTNLIEIFKDKRIKNLVDYVTGIEVGLDTNARKNRTGTQMELVVLEYIKKIDGIEYIEQANFTKINSSFGIKLDTTLSDVSKNKRFDFVIKNKQTNHIYLIETNYYRTTGSKLNETARSYEKINNDLKEVSNVSFIWITDGIGWLKTQNDLRKAFDSIEHLYNIDDLKNNVLNNLIKNE